MIDLFLLRELAGMYRTLMNVSSTVYRHQFQYLCDTTNGSFGGWNGPDVGDFVVIDSIDIVRVYNTCTNESAQELSKEIDREPPL